MSADTVANLFFEEIQDARRAQQQIANTLARIAEGASVKRLSKVAERILNTTERRLARLDRIVHEIGPAQNAGTTFRPAAAEGSARLTPREVEVLKLIAEGFANKQIAAELAISIKTVEKHRQHMMAKLDLHDTAGVTRYAISAGLVEAVA